MNEVIGTVVRQDQVIAECKDKIEYLQGQLERCTLKIQGIIEVANENCVELVQKFFKEKLGIQKEILMNEAYRVGSGETSVIQMVLKH